MGDRIDFDALIGNGPRVLFHAKAGPCTVCDRFCMLPLVPSFALRDRLCWECWDWALGLDGRLERWIE